MPTLILNHIDTHTHTQADRYAQMASALEVKINLFKLNMKNIC